MTDLATLLPCIALGIALAACTGLRAWLPLLSAGLLARSGWLEMGSAFDFLASDRALILFAVATVLEIAADKIPALDHTLDAMSTVIRPAAGALIAASVMWNVSDPLTALVLGTAVGAPASLVPHAMKTGLRAASSAFTGGLANPVISIIEDVVTVVLVVMAVLVPLAVVGLLAFSMFVVTRRLLRRSSSSASIVPAA